MSERAAASQPRERVSILLDSVAGTEPDEAILAFASSDGSRCSGPEMVLQAGLVGTWEIQVTIVGRPVTAGGGLLFQNRGFNLGYCTQDYNPLGRDYVTLEARAPGARLALIVNTLNTHHCDSYAQIVVEAGELRPGDSLLLRIGDRRFGGPGIEGSDVTTMARFPISVDRTGAGVYRQLASSPLRVRVASEPRVDMIRVLGPSIVAPGEGFALNVAAFDRHRNVCEQFRGEIALSASAAVLGVPEGIRFDPEDRGALVVPGISISQLGVHRIESTVGDLRALSNPILCQREPKRRLLWGDLHCHSWGDAERRKMLDEPSFKLAPMARHQQARRVGRLDFCAPGPMSPPIQEERPEIWRAFQEAYKRNDEPGRYVPFLAYEAHTGRGPGAKAGDRNVIFCGWSDGYLPTHSSAEELFQTYGDRQDVLLESHVGGGPANWDAYPTREERLLEIASGHGCFEWLLQEALSRGYRPAVIGSGDTHLGVFGGPIAAHIFMGRFGGRLNVRDTGFGVGPLAGVWAERCERGALWQAIAQRRTMATTGVRIILDVQVNGCAAGGETSCKAPSVTTRIALHACAPVQRVDLIRGDRCLKSWHSLEMDVELAHCDEQPLRQAPYYVRLRQVDGEYAWSTPVWVTCLAGDQAPQADLPLWNAHEPTGSSGWQPEAAANHMPDLLRYLEIEEGAGRFSDITPVGMVHETPGEAALFHALIEPEHEPVSIRWYAGFELARIHLDFGWRDFGARAT